MATPAQAKNRFRSACAWFERVAGYERRFDCTIQRARSVRDLVDCDTLARLP